MRVLSVRDGFAPDHSTQTYRYTAPDKGTAWQSFWKGLPVVDGDEYDDRRRDPVGVVVGLRAKGRAIGTVGFVRSVA